MERSFILDMFNNEAKLNDTIQNLITYVPPSLIPGDDTQKMLDIQNFVPTVDMEKVVKSLREFYFNNDDTNCCNNCKMAKVLRNITPLSQRAEPNHPLQF